MVSLNVPHLLFEGLVVGRQRCLSGWRGNTWASFRPPAHLISTHISSLTPEFTMIHSKWIYFQRFIYNCVNKSVSRSAFWCLPFIWYRHRAQNKCALLVSLPQTIGGQGDTKLLLPSASLWFDDFILFLFCADKGVSGGILAHGRKKMTYCKETMENQKTHPKL